VLCPGADPLLSLVKRSCSDRAAFPAGEKQAPVFRDSPLPAPEQESGGAKAVNNVGGIGAFHVKIDALLFKQFHHLRRARRDNDQSLGIPRRREHSSNVICKRAKVFSHRITRPLENNRKCECFRFRRLFGLCLRVYYGEQERDTDQHHGDCTRRVFHDGILTFYRPLRKDGQ